VKLDHYVIPVSDWERSNPFYRDVLGAELVRKRSGWSYRFGDQQLNLHGHGVDAAPVAKLAVRPGNSELCFEGPGPIGDARAHLEQSGVDVEDGPAERFGARGTGRNLYFRDSDDSLLEFISYPGA
jgi:catechol 2,3-dioxygenase-like lactoylglutathione lyase family enzyme